MVWKTEMDKNNKKSMGKVSLRRFKQDMTVKSRWTPSTGTIMLVGHCSKAVQYWQDTWTKWKIIYNAFLFI